MDAVLTAHKLPNEPWTSYANRQFMYADGTTTPPPIQTYVAPDPTVRNLILGFVGAFVLAGILVHMYVTHKRRQADSVWSVDPSELKYPQPPEVIGQGTFGWVVLAEYRGTQVAVKRVLPQQQQSNDMGNHHQWSHLLFQDNKSTVEESSSSSALKDDSHTTTTEPKDTKKDDIESGGHHHHTNNNNNKGDRSSVGGTKSGDTKSLGFKSGTISNSSTDTTGNTTLFHRLMIPFWGSRSSRHNNHNSNNNSSSHWQHHSLKQDFMAEMRYLSKLRHPCVTTVMGAVIQKGHDPMLVMEYMDHGSLHDLLHNETLVLDGDLVLPILRDIAQGLRFLHAATPQVIHVS